MVDSQQQNKEETYSSAELGEAPFFVMSKPAGARCNLACEYCYYLEKEEMYGNVRKEEMSDALLEKFVKEYIQSQIQPQVLFTWHGGEPLLRGLSFYKKAATLQRAYAEGRQIDNCLQTNGTLLTDEWCEFFAKEGWLIGISIDGTQAMHDTYRHTRGKGPSWAQVMRGIDLLNKHGVEWNAMATVNAYNAKYPTEFYNFFRNIGCQYLQFAPIVERTTNGHLASVKDIDGKLAPFSVSPTDWGNFCIGVFDEWINNDVGNIFVQLFEATLANWMGIPSGLCSMSESCGNNVVMEHNGDVFSCDHFVFSEYYLGNIHKMPLRQMIHGEKQRRFARIKQEMLPQMCKECEWYFACHGECPRNRFSTTPNGEHHLNYLCKGYQQFFSHVAPYMDYMKRELQAGRELRCIDTKNFNI